MGLILDSSAVIAAERGGETAERLVERVVRIAGDQETALSEVGLTELVHGLHRANTPALRLRRQAFLDDLLAGCRYIPTRKRRLCSQGDWMLSRKFAAS
jgi:predicted nucleic acid-binding protein